MFKKLNIKKVALWLFIIMIASFAIAGTIFYQSGGYNELVKGTSGHNIDETLPFTANGINEIRIDCDSPNVNIIPSDSNDIRVHFHGTAAVNKNNHYPKLNARIENNKLVIKVDGTITIGINLGIFKELNLDVHVPKTYSSDILVNATSGNIAVQGLNLNNLNCKSNSGNLSLQSVTAKKGQLKTTSGNATGNEINVDRLNCQCFSGNIKMDSLSSTETTLKTTSGEIDVLKFTGDLKANSFSGNVFVEYTTFNNNVDVSATSGEVSIQLPETAEFYLRANASSGKITNTFPLTVDGDKSRHHLEGTVVNGNNRITVKTFSGDIEITK